MAWTNLPTDYKDAVWSGLRKYVQITNDDGTVSFQDVTAYTQKENSFFGAEDANQMNSAMNELGANIESVATNTATVIAKTEVAVTSATNAATSEKNAKTSETNSATSEKNAATSEKNAKTSETNAASSESSVAASEKKISDLLDGAGVLKIWLPTVSTTGLLSWVKSATETAPTSVNIKGEKGNTGDKGDSGVYVGTGSLPAGTKVWVNPSGTDVFTPITDEQINALFS